VTKLKNLSLATEVLCVCRICQ